MRSERRATRRSMRCGKNSGRISHRRDTGRVSAALDLITDRVRERVRREGVDLATDSELADRYVREEVRSYSERALGGSSPMLGDETAAARQIIAAVTGLGPLQPLLDDPSVEEVWINAPDRIFIARNGVSERIHLDLTEADVRDLVERMLRSTGRRVDLSLAVRRRLAARRVAAARRDPRHHAGALGRQHPQVPQRDARPPRTRAARVALTEGRRVSARRGVGGAQHPRLGRDAVGQDDDARSAAGIRPPGGAHRHRRGDLRTRCRRARLGRAAVPAGLARRVGRSHAASARERGTPDAPRPARGRRGARGRGARPADRAQLGSARDVLAARQLRE